MPAIDLSYASPCDSRLTRAFIHLVEATTGQIELKRLYNIYQTELLGSVDFWEAAMRLMRLSIEYDPNKLEALPRTGPLVIVANHPFGIGDGIAVLSLAEQLGRPFRVMIHKDLLRIREMEPFSLPVDFSETKEALQSNMAMRHEAVRLLKEGVTIVIFPAGGVATAPKVFGRAIDLPWKMFPAKLVQEAKASVIPMHFSGQNGRLFHLVSGPMNMAERDNRVAKFIGRTSLTLRLSLLIREFARLSGREIEVRIGDVLTWSDLEPLRDRKALLDRLYRAVFDLAAPAAQRGRVPFLPKRIRKAA